MNIKSPEVGIYALLVTALISLLMGVFGKAAAEWSLNQILRPIRFVKEAIYRMIAPRNPLSISLRSYKKRVSRSALTRIENPVGPDLDVPLEHAFAPLKLVSSATEERVDLFSKAAKSHKFIVLGGPGTGKTTLMKSLVTGVLKGGTREEALSNLIPVFVVLRNLAKKEHTVEQAIVAAFADYHFPGADKFVASALSQGKLLIILDGLDEVGASREFVSAQIQNFCEHDEQRDHPNRLIVTCREHSYQTKDLSGVIRDIVRVEPFANHHMRVFLEGWPAHKGQPAVGLYGLIQGDPQIRDICRNPLLLTILTGLYLDTDNFELPASRERFYKNAVDELLEHRPARRQIKQTFAPRDKSQILERVALERLETVTRQEDPEEFTEEVIRLKAEIVLRRDGVDARELIKEMVEINGIIRPASEGSYTCAHRTIQEYFAAREARRTRETREVVEHFGSRPESGFIEVLYFYCGLVGNIPALTFVINTLAGQGKWVEAGRCMLQMKEPPARELVGRVAAELHSQVGPSIESKAALEVLSSLAQRNPPEFEPARELFARAVDRLTGEYGERGASALESALATSPEAAMNVIPGLLRHQSQRWQEAAVLLLRDIGTDEALDQLVQLLKDSDSFIRDRAARTLAGMIGGRGRDLCRRAVLLPARCDFAVWPFEERFPGRLAIPIAESIMDPVDTTSEAINNAAVALRSTGTGTEDAKSFLLRWQRVRRDLKLRNWKAKAARLILLLGGAQLIAFVLTMIIVGCWSLWANKTVITTLKPLRTHTVDPTVFEEVSKRADIIANKIESAFPPNASGVARILPWNWNVEPNLPSEIEAAYASFLGLRGYEFNVYSNPNLDSELDKSAGFIPREDIAQLRDALINLRHRLPETQGPRLSVHHPRYSLVALQLFSLVYSVASGVSWWRRYKMWVEERQTLRRHSLLRRKRLSNQYPSFTQLVVFTILFLTTFYMFHYFLLLHSASFSVFLPVLLCGGAAGASLLLRKLQWPKNPYLRSADDLAVPPATSDRNWLGG